MLHNIASTVPSWSKVTSGLIKMYREEVLKKVPVVQHFRFGEVLAWKRESTGEGMESGGDGRGEEEMVEGAREGVEGTVAPWSIPSLSGIASPSISTAPLNRQTSTSVTGSSVAPPQSFAQPVLFPPRSRSQLGSTSTVSDAGGAAANSSPFGVLESVRRGGGGKGEDRLPWGKEE